MAHRVRCDDEHPDDGRADGGKEHAARRNILGPLYGGVYGGRCHVAEGLKGSVECLGRPYRHDRRYNHTPLQAREPYRETYHQHRGGSCCVDPRVMLGTKKGTDTSSCIAETPGPGPEADGSPIAHIELLKYWIEGGDIPVRGAASGADLDTT